MAMTNAAKQAAFKARMMEQGYARTPVWVPQSRKAELKAYVKALCNGESPTAAPEPKPKSVNKAGAPPPDDLTKTWAKLPKSTKDALTEHFQQELARQLGQRVSLERERLSQRHKELDRQGRMYADWVNNKAMTKDEYKLVLSCLHPDRPAPEARKNKAFNMFRRLGDLFPKSRK